jgi:hypothetical protein
MKYKLVPVKNLRALEYVFPNHLKNLKNLIYKEKIITLPLIVENKHNIVLDGSHRHVFLAMEGFKLAPVHYVDYTNSHIRVGTHLMHRHLIEGPVNISKEEVIRRGLAGDLFPPRTTRHFFPFRKTDTIDVPLSKLEKGKPIDMNAHIAKVSIQDEINHNLNFVKEIEDETDELIRYLGETRQTRKYLLFQIEEMKKNL